MTCFHDNKYTSVGPWAQHSLAKQTNLATASYPQRHGGASGNITFLDLAPDTRNQIYDLIYRFHSRIGQQITICDEEGAREVPSAISRICRQIRSETLPYFIDKAAVIFVVTDASNLAACREWVDFTPDYAIEMIETIRIRHAHPLKGMPRRQCSITFELDFHPANARRVTYWGQGSEACRYCVPEAVDTVQLVQRIKHMLLGMNVEGKVTRSGLVSIFDELAPLIGT